MLRKYLKNDSGYEVRHVTELLVGVYRRLCTCIVKARDMQT